jgi:hypothetical protein
MRRKKPGAPVTVEISTAPALADLQVITAMMGRQSPDHAPIAPEIVVAFALRQVAKMWVGEVREPGS